jgi:hypothetical protein
MPAHPPVVIEAALNGMTTSDRNPHVPRTVNEIVASYELPTGSFPALWGLTRVDGPWLTVVDF